jgi:V/A-type H+-transporting ATPase subunit F
MKIWVIGHSEAVLGFALAGLGGRAVQTAAEVHAALDEALKAADTGIVLVTKDVARLAQGRMDELKLRSTLPLIVEVPSPEGAPEGEPTLGELVLRAIGIKL